MKSYLKWGAIAAALVCVALVFQNCSKSKKSSSTGEASVYGQDAQNIISVMEGAGIVDKAAQSSLTVPETINLIATSMICSRVNTGTARQCVFYFKNSDGVTKSAKSTTSAVDSIIQMLAASGIKCANNCNDVESYTVVSVKCIKNTNFPDQSQCSFIK
ncbi:MAG: hypothetical protein ABL930_00800 [Pseudobdellovibrio sp.]